MFFSKFTSFAPDYNRKPPCEGPPRQRLPRPSKQGAEARYGQKSNSLALASASIHPPTTSVSSKDNARLDEHANTSMPKTTPSRNKPRDAFSYKSKEKTRQRQRFTAAAVA